MEKQTPFIGSFEVLPVILDDDKKVIANELERLYAFQDRQLSTATKAMLVKELSDSSLSLEAIIYAIRQLTLVELDRVKLPAIVMKAREFMNQKTNTELAAKDCTECQMGLILMLDDDKREFVLACKCERGASHRKAGLALWEGEEIQYRNHRQLKRKPHAMAARQ